jgi:hypothetical protein
MLIDEELGRHDLSIIGAHEKIERKKAEEAKMKVIHIKTKEIVPNAGL